MFIVIKFVGDHISGLFCRCGDEFWGEYCQDRNPCLNYCMNGGVCRIDNSTGGKTCLCPVGKFPEPT